MMTSNTASATATTATATAAEYTTVWRDGWTHEWNINKAANENETRCAIDDYYSGEARVFSPDQAYPLHHALVRFACHSASKLMSSSRSSISRRAHYSAFIETSTSRHHLIGISGMSGLLVRRILGHGHKHGRNNAHRRHIRGITIAPFPFGDLHETTKQSYANIMNRFIHSALAAEYIIGNRYFRSVTVSRNAIVALAASNRYYSDDGNGNGDGNVDGNGVVLNDEQRRRVVRDPECPVGMLSCDATKNLTARDVTHQSLEITKQELCEAYSANIVRLMSAIQQFRRGFVSIDTIRTDPEFIRLITAFWRYSSQLMKLKTLFEERDATAASKLPFRAVRPTDYYTFSENKDAKRFIVLSLISEPAVLVPLLYNYDVARIFDNWRQSYTKYVKTTKTTWARLANDGSTSAFLAFAAVEPGMVTSNYAPTLGGNSAYHTLSMKGCANHIPSRHPVFGALRIKHRHHIKCTADVLNTTHANISTNHCKVNVGIHRTPERLQPTYTAFSEMVDDIRQPESILEFGIECRKVIRPNSGMIINKKETCDKYTNDTDETDGEW
jgi:hypothetical protein